MSTATKKPADKKTAKKTTKPKASPPTGDLLATETRRQAELLAAADALLCRMESEADAGEILPGRWRLSIAEQRLLGIALPELDNNHKIADRLKRVRKSRLLRESGVSLESVQAAREKYDAALLAVSEARADVKAFEGVESGLLADHLKAVQAKIDKLHDEAEDAKSGWESARKDYHKLLRLAPKCLIESVENLHRKSPVPKLQAALDRTRATIAGAKHSSKSLRSVDALQQGEKATMFSWLYSELPEAIYRSADKTHDQVDAAKCQERAAEVEAKLLTLEEQERDQLAEIDDALNAVNAPLASWAETGVLSVELLLS